MTNFNEMTKKMQSMNSYLNDWDIINMEFSENDKDLTIRKDVTKRDGTPYDRVEHSQFARVRIFNTVTHVHFWVSRITFDLERYNSPNTWELSWDELKRFEKFVEKLETM